MREPPDYDTKELEAWKENERMVSERFENRESNIMKRIQTFIWRFGFPRDEVHEKIEKDRMFAAHFAKEPRRTKLHERAAAEWLQETPHISGFETLPTSGRNAFYITSDGEIRKGMENPPGKSVDFYWKTGRTDFYAFHKYTKEGGGNQDSQYKEMRNALERFQGSAERSKVLLIIVDGPYYTPAKMDDLLRFVRDRPPRSYACHIEDVPEILMEYV